MLLKRLAHTQTTEVRAERVRGATSPRTLVHLARLSPAAAVEQHSTHRRNLAVHGAPAGVRCTAQGSGQLLSPWQVGLQRVCAEDRVRRAAACDAESFELVRGWALREAQLDGASPSRAVAHEHPGAHEAAAALREGEEGQSGRREREALCQRNASSAARVQPILHSTSRW